MGKSSPDVSTVAGTCFGVSIAVQCRPIDVADVAAQLPLGYDASGSIQAEHRFTFACHGDDESLFCIRRGHRKPSPPEPRHRALRTLQREIHICVAEHSTTRVFIHAGVVAWNNRAAIFPGSSHAGKSTLVWSLVQAGATYYSDEYAVFDEQGRVHPFLLPIALRLADGDRRTIVPEHSGSAPLTPSLIVFARYRSGAQWRPEFLRPADTMVQLIRHSIAIRKQPSVVLPVLKQASLQARSFLGLRGDVKELLAWLKQVD